MAIAAAMLGRSAAELVARHDARGGTEDSAARAAPVPIKARPADQINQRMTQTE
jgi:hypothetical protein